MTEIIIKKNDEGQTIIRFLKKIIDYKSQKINLYKLLRTKKVKVNNKVLKDSKYILRYNDKIQIYYNLKFLKNRENITPTDVKLEVVYEDQNLLIVIKNHNLLIHNYCGNSLDNIVKNYLINKNEYNLDEIQSFKVSHIHRLDKLTKGLVIYAKNKKALDYLLSIINNNDCIEKYYLLECEGIFSQDEISVDGYIYKDIENKKMQFTKKKIYNNMKTSKTIFKKIQTKEDSTILEAKLLTGRKNQIRASLEFLKHPIINDYKYGAKKYSNEQFINLTAYKIIFKNLKNDFAYLSGKEIKIKVKFN